MKIFFYVSLAYFSLAIHAEELLELEATTASYDGATVSLSGSVHVLHDIGSIHAEEVTLYAAKKDKKAAFSKAAMQKNVAFSIKGAGEFYCVKAELDREAMCGNFYGCLEKNVPVSYVEQVKGKRDTLAPLIFKSLHMRMHIAAKAGKNFIDRIYANEHVEVDYNKNFTLTADKAIYKRKPLLEGESAFVKTMPGSVMLEPAPGEKCLATNVQGDRIESDKMSIDINRREILFEQPTGKICTALEKKPIAFSSEQLLWDLAHKLLKLKGNVHLQQAPGSTCCTDKELHIHYAEVKGKKELRSIESFGKTRLQHLATYKADEHYLSCAGRVFVDHQAMKTTMECLRDAAGKVIPGTYVHFRGSVGELKAEKATLTYQLKDGKMVVSHILAEGNVSLLGAKKEKGKCYYALADKVEYTPEKKEVYCSSEALGQKRVLFYDQTNQLQISAPALKIVKEAKKESIQGLGDVRLSFLESEFAQIKKHFNL